MGSINAIPEFKDYYKLGEKGAASTGLVFSIFQIGQMVGALFIWICDLRGRRLAISVGCLGVALASILTALAPSLGVFIGGRFLLSFFATIATVAAPLYLVEIAPPWIVGPSRECTTHFTTSEVSSLLARYVDLTSDFQAT